jgi:putative oxidoreductase
MDIVFLAGRIVFGALFVMSGLTFHLLQAKQATGYARAYRVPMPDVLVPLTGVQILAGGLMVALGLWGDLGALLIAAFLLPTAFFMHAFWREEDPMQKQNQMAHFQKDVALAGAALVLFYAWNQLQGDAGLSLTDPLFGRW